MGVCIMQYLFIELALIKRYNKNNVRLFKIRGVEMPKIKPFNEHSQEYDSWYNENQNIYKAELDAIKSFIPPGLYGVEIGVGTGRFAIPLGVKVGVEPSNSMAEIARTHGINVLDGIAENLPLGSGEFNFVLMVTAICFFDDVGKAFEEAYRVLKDNGFLVVAFIDKESDLGKLYEKYKQNNEYYKDATFYSVKEVTDFLYLAGFEYFEFRQTVFTHENIIHDVDIGDVDIGFERGGFVVKATK